MKLTPPTVLITHSGFMKQTSGGNPPLTKRS
jgi:hypothetical protein